MAGRNISASHVAFTSTRVMGTCAVEGQAIGTAAALCAAREMTPKQLYEDKAALTLLRQRLLRNDQTIKQGVNEDPEDLARRADEVVASSEIEGSKAANVVNGRVRDLPGEWRNRWGGAMTEDGAWIELRWKEPQTISLVQLCFDTGFSRELTLSEHHGVRTGQVRGPQPETVRDYRLLYYDEEVDAWKEAACVQGNYQRLRRHVFPAASTRKVRLEIAALNGGAEARLYEIRCYA